MTCLAVEKTVKDLLVNTATQNETSFGIQFLKKNKLDAAAIFGCGR
jgi:hypothetical protein